MNSLFFNGSYEYITLLIKSIMTYPEDSVSKEFYAGNNLLINIMYVKNPYSYRPAWLQNTE